MTEQIIKYQKIEERKICDKRGGGQKEEEEKKRERNMSMSKENKIN